MAVYSIDVKFHSEGDPEEIRAQIEKALDDAQIIAALGEVCYVMPFDFVARKLAEANLDFDDMED